MKEKDNFILDIKRLGINGEGIGYYNKLAIFVKNAIPGEGVDIEITKSEPKMAFGKIKTIKRKSPYRIEPICKYYESCGACQTMHIDYKKTGEFKRDLIIESIRRYTNLNPLSFQIKDTILSDSLHYRNKATLVVRRDNGKNSLGMIEEGSNISFAVESCLVQDDLINEVNTNIINLSNELAIKSLGCDTYSWLFLSTRVSLKTKERQVCLIVKEYNNEIKKFCNKILENKLCDSLYVNINNKKTHELFGEETIFIGGKEYICEYIDNLKFKLYPNTFFQLNTKQTSVLYEQVLKACKLTHKETVLDAFCGVGTIALYLSRFSKKVIGIEYNNDSIKLANDNIKLNKIKKPVEFYQGDVTKLFSKVTLENNIDTLVFDPPRTGLGETLCNLVNSSNIKNIVYVSCNHSTLAKDLNILSYNYKVKYIQPVDMFPHTSHVESIVKLDLK